MADNFSVSGLSSMRIPPAEYLNLKLRVHELLREVPLYDVSAVDLPDGGSGRTIADIRALETNSGASLIVKGLFGVRLFLGRVFGWDREPIRPKESLLSRLSEQDRRESQVAPGTPRGLFLLLYQFPNESLAEIRNTTVHGWLCTALAPTETGYRLYWGVYVLPVSWLTRPYLMAIEPFRRVLYPAIFRRIRREWVAAYGGPPRGH